MEREIELGGRRLRYLSRRHLRSRHIRFIIHSDGRLVLVRPYHVSLARAEAFLLSRQEEIARQLAKLSQKGIPSPAQRRQNYLHNKEAARRLILERLEYFNAHYRLRYAKVFVRDQRTRWGSCSRGGNLSFSYRLLGLSPEARDYVIVHELCHLKEMNHSPRFWRLVAEAVPHYQKLRRELKKSPLF